ncbi:hypothetical protein GJ496_000462 [Pomphorhynchus laevis]|nr:hypothetical protein GJ496_000462 [Pomphorhynchus laevis]
MSQQTRNKWLLGISIFNLVFAIIEILPRYSTSYTIGIESIILIITSSIGIHIARQLIGTSIVKRGYSGNDRVNVDFWIELDKLIKGKTVSICGDLIQIPNQEDLSYASRIITDFIHDHGIGFTALSVCKILYGIDSYEHPKVIWQTIKKYWNSMKSIPFDQLLSLADNKLQATRKIWFVQSRDNIVAARSIALLPDQLLCCQINCSAARSIALLPDQLLCCQINCSAARSIALLPDQLLCCQINCSAARSIALLPDQLLCCQINCSAARSIVLHHP